MKRVSRKVAERTKNHSEASVFAHFTPLAIKHNAVNLGQGFPNFKVEGFVKESGVRAMNSTLHQYTNLFAHPRLADALLNEYCLHFRSPLLSHNITTTVGATEGIFSTIATFIDPGDEVIMFEPFYDAYPADIELMGAHPVYVPLKFAHPHHHSSLWKIDKTELETKISKKTKMIILNNPMNVIGKVFEMEELQIIADLAKQYDLLVLSDEVYEWIGPYDNKKHIRIANLDGMFERTITVGSAGKTFGVTGWKIGWIIGPPHLTIPINNTHQWTTYSHNTPLQEAVGECIEEARERGYYGSIQQRYEAKRNKLLASLHDVGLDGVVCSGTFFCLASTSKIKKSVYIDSNSNKTADYQFCEWLTKEIGVCAIPPSAFYSSPNKHLVSNFARFAFCKTDHDLDLAHQKLRKLVDKQFF